MFSLIYKIFRKVFYSIDLVYSYVVTRLLLYGNAVKYSSILTSGIPYIMVARGGKMSIGENFSINNGIKGNPIGCYERCTFFVDKGAVLTIGDNVGISQTALICHKSISIGDNVKIGGGVCIYDTDFHSLDSEIRRSKKDIKHRVEKPVIIHDNVFIGAKSIILKGVEIGENSIIGAGSVVTKSVPANQIWAGNPAHFIRNLTKN
jgi:acetyltransferase-like isoleucine patch superfamily enzyme